MISPLDALKVFINLKSYLTWFLIATTVFGLFCFIKNKFFHNQNTTTLKSYLIYFLIILALFSFLYLSFFHKTEPSSKYVGQLITKIDEAIDKRYDIINNYNGLQKYWEKELNQVKTELKELYKAKEITQEQKEKIKEALDNQETKIKEIKEKLSKNTENITILKGKLIQLEKDKEAKEKEIKQKQEEEKLASPDDKIRLKAEIEKLQDEKSEIIEKIGKIKVEIGILESEQEMYEGMLSDAIKLRDSLQRDYDKLTSVEQKLFAKIKTAEERKAEIQKNIDEIDAKIRTIGAEINQLKILREGAEAAKVALDDWDKKHEFSFGNLRDALFQGAELYMDAFGGRGYLKALGSGVTKEAAGTIAKAGLVIHESHRVINLAKELFLNQDGTPKMMSEATYNSICSRIDRDLAEIKNDYKDCEKKKEEYQKKQNPSNLNEEIQGERKQLDNFKDQDRSVLAEYRKIIFELDKNRKKVSNTNNLYNAKERLEKKLVSTNVEIETTEEELKQKNPNHERSKQRLKEKQYAKFYQPNPNK
ncbi:tetraspanin family protein [Mulberry dwarf phytoplasma]|uniref:tetraspanin family protein n=1 Tax=Mulberry dwarf phytoplasma TaxID=186171 RepID=UPI001D0F6C75|nr:tetraspanin family protein [Mulberry dwarf phytoplasma]